MTPLFTFDVINDFQINKLKLQFFESKLIDLLINVIEYKSCRKIDY